MHRTGCKSNSCYLKQNNSAPSKQTKILEVFIVSLDVDHEIPCSLCLFWSVFSNILHHRVRVIGSFVLMERGSINLLSRSCLFTYLFCLALRVKWPSRVWDSMKTCEHVSCKGSSHQLQKLVKRHTDSDPKELLNLSDITSVATCIIIQCSDGEPAEDLTYYNPFYEHHP